MPPLGKDDLLNRVKHVLNKHSQLKTDGSYLESGSAGAFRSAGLSLLLDLYGTDHHHYTDFAELTKARLALGYTARVLGDGRTKKSRRRDKPTRCLTA
jgi:hypothetical protein